jgi:hypothetical protein
VLTKCSLLPDLTGLVAVILWRLARVLEEIVLSAFINFRWLINSVRLTTTEDSRLCIQEK